MNSNLEKRLRAVDREALLDWVLEKTARRGEERTNKKTVYRRAFLC